MQWSGFRFSVSTLSRTNIQYDLHDLRRFQATVLVQKCTQKIVATGNETHDHIKKKKK